MSCTVNLRDQCTKVCFSGDKAAAEKVGKLGTYGRSVAIFRETRNGVHPISGAKNQATAMAFGGHVRPVFVPARTPRCARTPAIT